MRHAGAMTETLSPFLMFENQQAEPAMDLYRGLFPNAVVSDIQRYGADGPGPEGSIIRASLVLAGQTVVFSDSFVGHAFTFTPSISLFLELDDEARFETVSTALAEGGQLLMPPGDYGFSRRFVWLNDRFGVSWQINLT
jgi:predicted 3-demethylubiquinone-9 3-methyltransferase (glyoxalase superfamily)